MRRRAEEGLLGLMLLLLLAAFPLGCVTKGTYEQVVSERDRLTRENTQLSKRVAHLDASTQSLDDERAKLIGEVEELTEERERLAADRKKLTVEVEVLRESEKELGQELAAATSEVEALQSTYQNLVDDLENELARGEIEIAQLRSGLQVAVSDDILFRSGSAIVGPDGREVLSRVAGHLREIDYAIEIVGHTDNVPIKGQLTQRYPTNWELAGARAAQVARLFMESGIPGERLHAISRAEYEPVASNDTEEGRRLNRRIDIRLRPTAESDLRQEVAPGAKAKAPKAPTHTDSAE